MIKPLENITVYQNPKPALCNRQAAFPGVIRVSEKELLALFVIGEAFESVDSRTYISKSSDNGLTWSAPLPLYDQSKQNMPWPVTDCYKPTLLKSGTILAAGYGFFRKDISKGISEIAEISGELPDGANYLTLSHDKGQTWSPPKEISHQFGRFLEISGPCLETSEGKLIIAAPVFTLKKGAQRGVVLESTDEGSCWRHIGDYNSETNIAAWETRIIETETGTLIALYWAYHIDKQEHLPNQFTYSSDGGKTWSRPQSTGFMGQASNLISIGSNKILTVHCQRSDNPGIFIRVVDFSGNTWKVVQEEMVWNGGMIKKKHDTAISKEFAALKFGQPSLLSLSNSEFYLFFWCTETCMYKIKAIKFSL